MPQTPLARLYRFAVATLVFTLAVILWGAFVRATGSGAGCGNHWPTCNGEIIPRSPGAKTLVEFTHRTTSGLAFLMVAAQMVWALRVAPRGHAVRRLGVLAFVLMIVEALVGAGLVIFEMVAGNTETARAYWMAAHLLNTFALLAAMGRFIVAIDRARGGAVVEPLAGAAAFVRGLRLGLALVLLVAVSGAVVALGDTLFPARSLAEGLAQDFSAAAHPFVQLRVAHPVLAVVAALYLLVVAALVAGRDGAAGTLRRPATRVAALVLLQMAIGVANLLLLAPTALQLVHLLVADLLWLALIGLEADASAAARGAFARAPVELVAAQAGRAR